MLRRHEPVRSVPFAFVAEAEEFRSNVTPPPRERAGAGRIVGRTLIGLIVVAGLAGSLLFGLPAMQPTQSSGQTQQSQAADGR